MSVRETEFSLEGRSAIVTGASQGLGEAIARDYVRSGANVMLCARNQDKLDAAVDRLRTLARPGQKVLARRVDIANEADIDTLVAASVEAFGTIDILVNNAGIHGSIGLLEEVDWRGWAEAIGVNILGTVYACRAVLPHMKARGYGKIINLSGGGATSPMPRMSAYATSKAAVVRFTETLALEVRDHKIDVNAIAPGALATRLLDEVLAAGPERVGAAYHARMTKIAAEGGTSLDVGAGLCAWLGSAESDGITGKLLAAVWDPWRTLQDHAADLDGGDIYTLRRILPKERGKDWGED